MLPPLCGLGFLSIFSVCTRWLAALRAEKRQSVGALNTERAHLLVQVGAFHAEQRGCA